MDGLGSRTRLDKKVLCNFIVHRIKKLQQRNRCFLGGYGIFRQSQAGAVAG